MIPERLKSSRRLTVEVAIAGLALWQLKKEINRRNISPTEDVIEPPVSEFFDGNTVFVWTDSYDEDREPKGIEVGVIGDDGSSARVYGRIEDGKTKKMKKLQYDGSREALRSLKNRLTRAKEIIESRNT